MNAEDKELESELVTLLLIPGTLTGGTMDLPVVLLEPSNGEKGLELISGVAEGPVLLAEVGNLKSWAMRTEVGTRCSLMGSIGGKGGAEVALFARATDRADLLWY